MQLTNSPLNQGYFTMVNFQIAKDAGWIVQPMYKKPGEQGYYGATHFSAEYAAAKDYTEVGWKWRNPAAARYYWVEAPHDKPPPIPPEILNEINNKVCESMDNIYKDIKNVKIRNGIMP